MNAVHDRLILPRSSKGTRLCSDALCALTLLLRRRWIVSFVADAHGMRLAAMARPAGDLLLANRKNTCSGKLRIDLPHQQDHLARNILTRIEIPFLRLSAAMTIVTVNAQCVTELAHQGIRTVHVGIRRQQLQTDSRRLRRRRVT